MKFTVNPHTSDVLELTIRDLFRLLLGKKLKHNGIEVFVPEIRSI